MRRRQLSQPHQIIGEIVMKPKTPEERLKEAQRIVARYVREDRDLVSELIAERRAEAAAECAEATYARMDIVGIDRRKQNHGGAAPASNKAKGGDE